MTTSKHRFTGGTGYAPFDATTVTHFLAGLPGELTARLGGRRDAWAVKEVGDGNLNLVFIVKGPEGGLVVKQALPYVRVFGEGWPLSTDRGYFEARALEVQNRLAPGLTPTLFHFEPAQAASVMELLEPHVILRKGLIAGQRYPRFAEDIARFLAATLFGTSDLGMPAAQKRALAEVFSANVELCNISEELIFTDPYRVHQRNRWTSPQLDSTAARFRTDAALKVAAQELKWRFLSAGEALVHGDLHTGSIMVTRDDTRAIDPEFAFVGPMGFDVGAVLANLLLAFFAQPGQATPVDPREEHAAWLLGQVKEVWTRFEAHFLARWREAAGAGDAFGGGLFTDEASRTALEGVRQRTMRALLADSVGFAGAKMVRRILGFAHVADLEGIADPSVRARCEEQALALGRELLLTRQAVRSIDEVLALARAVVEARP